MIRNTVSLVLFITILSVSVHWSQQVAQSQSSDNAWTPFVNVSNTPTASTYPCIAADSAGNIHMLWSEDVGGRTRNLQNNTDGSSALDPRGKQINLLTHDGNSLLYTRWDGEKWLDPIDVQINPDGPVQYPQAVVDRHGILHAVWAAAEGQEAKLVYSKVTAAKAESANQWSAPKTLAESILFAYYPADIAIDLNGGIHVIYSQTGGEPGTYVVNSHDGGETWSVPIELYRSLGADDTQEGVSPTRLISDSKGRLHATWTQFGVDGNGKAIYYAQSQDFGQTWTEPMQMAAVQPGWYEVDWLSAGATGDEVHLVWEGSSNIAAIYERVSMDGGLTWSGARQILSRLVGENGFADLVVDSADQLHMLVVKRGDAGTISHGVWYTVWDKNFWLDPILLGISNPGLYSQLGQLTTSALQALMRGSLTGNGLRYQRTAVVNGNELFVVVVNEWDGDIWSTHTTLAAPHIAPQPYAPAPETPVPAPVLTSPSVSTPVPTLVSPSRPIQEQQVQNAGDPILVGSLPVLLLIAVTFVYVRVVRRMNT